MEFDDPSPRLEEWEIEYKEIVGDVYDKLRGYIIDSNGNKRKTSVPLLNSYGVGRFMTYFQSFLHKGIALSNLKDIEVQKFTYNTSKAFDREMVNKHKDWGLNLDSSEMVSQIFSINLYAVLSRAKDGKEQFWRAKKHKLNSSFTDKTKIDGDF